MKSILFGLWLSSVSILSVACTHQKPDFTGTWVVSDGTPIPGAPNNPDLVPEMTIQQDATTLTTFVTVRSKTNSSVRTKMAPVVTKLDGSERRTGDSISRTYWDGDTLVFETTRSQGGTVLSVFTNTWSLTSDGRMAIDHVLVNTGKPPAKYRSYSSKIH
jgi:hypothetical protein